MTPNGRAPRRYTDGEVRDLLDRATALETESGGLVAPSEGTTLAELEAVAEEVGIDPRALRVAARELDAGSSVSPVPPKGARGALGAPVSIQVQRTVEGEASESALERLLPPLQRACRGTGEPTLEGRSLTWQSENPEGTRTFLVRVNVSAGRTHLLVDERYDNMMWSIHGGIIGSLGLGGGLGVGLGVGLGALASATFATVFPLAALGGSYLLSRRISAWFVRKRYATLERLMDEMVGLVEED